MSRNTPYLEFTTSDHSDLGPRKRAKPCTNCRQRHLKVSAHELNDVPIKYVLILWQCSLGSSDSNGEPCDRCRQANLQCSRPWFPMHVLMCSMYNVTNHLSVWYIYTPVWRRWKVCTRPIFCPFLRQRNVPLEVIIKHFMLFNAVEAVTLALDCYRQSWTHMPG